MQRMLGRGMTINCFKFSCNTDKERGFEELEGQREEEEIYLQSHKWWLNTAGAAAKWPHHNAFHIFSFFKSRVFTAV